VVRGLEAVFGRAAGVEQRQAEVAREGQQVGVAAVDELAAALDDGACRTAHAFGPHAPADARGGLEHRDLAAGAGEQVGRREAGEAGTDDGHARRLPAHARQAFAGVQRAKALLTARRRRATVGRRALAHRQRNVTQRSSRMSFGQCTASMPGRMTQLCWRR
jgi:hypothetical protein